MVQFEVQKMLRFEHWLYRQKRKCLNEGCKAAWSLGQGTRLGLRKPGLLSQLCYCCLAFVCFRFPSSHLFVSVTQSNVPNLPVHTSPEEFGDLPPLAVPDSFLSFPNPAHGMIVTPSSAPLGGDFPPSPLHWWLCSWPWESWYWANKPR